MTLQVEKSPAARTMQRVWSRAAQPAMAVGFMSGAKKELSHDDFDDEEEYCYAYA